MKLKVLLVGGSYSALPIFRELKLRGFEVWIAGKDGSEPCVKYADGHIEIDYSERESLLMRIGNIGFAHIIPTCNDTSYLTAAYCAEKLGLDGLDTFENARILHSKNLFKQHIAKCAIPTPKFMVIDPNTAQNFENLKFPTLLKPPTNFSGIGIQHFQDLKSFREFISQKQITEFENYILEEFKSGSLHSISTFVKRGEPEVNFFADEFCTAYSYQVNCSNSPTFLPESIKEEVVESTRELVNNLKLKDGLLHIQFIRNEKEFWFIEAMRRCPGDLYGRMIELSTGYDYSEAFVAGFLSEKYKSISQNPFKFVARHTIGNSIPTIFERLSVKSGLNVVEVVPLQKVGADVEAAPFGKIGIVFLEFQEKVELRSTTNRLAEYINASGVVNL